MAIMYFTSKALDSIVEYKYDKLSIFMLVVMVEHLIIGFKMLIAILIKDKPEWITSEEHEVAPTIERYNLIIEHKKTQFKEKGGLLLEERINAVKEEQRKAVLEKMVQMK